MISQATIDELVNLRTNAKMTAEMFSDACSSQAEEHEINKAALRKYICALESDTLLKLDAEMESIARLIERNDGAS